MNEDLLKVHQTTNKTKGLAWKETDYPAMTNAESEFVMAVDAYRRLNNDRYPTLTKLLRILVVLGYRKVEQPITFEEANKLVMGGQI